MDESEFFLRIAQGDDYSEKYPLETPYGELTFYISPLSWSDRQDYLRRIPLPVRKHMGLVQDSEDASDVEERMPNGDDISIIEDMAVDFLHHPDFDNDEKRKVLEQLSDNDLLSIIQDVFNLGQNMDGLHQFVEHSGLATGVLICAEIIGLNADDPSELTDLQVVALQRIWFRRQKMITPEFE